MHQIFIPGEAYKIFSQQKSPDLQYALVLPKEVGRIYTETCSESVCGHSIEMTLREMMGIHYTYSFDT